VALSEDQLTPISATVGGDIILPVPYYTQRPYGNLCWAACCAMILGYYNKLPAGGINAIAGEVLGCDCSDLSQCNQVQAPADANPKAGINCTAWNYPFTLDGIIQELGAGRPIQPLLQLNGATHVILISGYTNQKLVVLDPWYGKALMAYDQLLNNYVDNGFWQFTYYMLTA